MIWLRRHLRFNGFIAIFVTISIISALPPLQLRLDSALLIGFDSAALVYLAVTLPAFAKLGPVGLRARAVRNGDNLHVLLVIAAVVFTVIMTALASELVDQSIVTVLGSAFTLALAWFYINVMFLQHYAQLFYMRGKAGDSGGLSFPGGELPDAWDLAYFSFAVATIFSVSDVTITTRRMRRVVMLHGILAFAFNIFAIGVSISLISNLFNSPSSSTTPMPAIHAN